MSDLTALQLTDIRENWIRDEWRDSPIFRGISHFNWATKSVFFSDPQLKSIDDYVTSEYTEELTATERAKRDERLLAGDDVTTAAATAAAARRGYRYKLIRAECLERQIVDPGFRKTLVDEKETLAEMKAQIAKDRNFVMRRTGIVSLKTKRG